MTITIDTSAYEATHGRKPRGNGAWIFTGTITPVTRRGERLPPEPVRFTITDAYRFAAARARERMRRHNQLDATLTLEA